MDGRSISSLASPATSQDTRSSTLKAMLRSVAHGVVPVTKIGSMLAWPLLLFGFILQPRRCPGGVVLFGAVCCSARDAAGRFNASHRALAVLRENGILGRRTGRRRSVLTRLR